MLVIAIAGLVGACSTEDGASDQTIAPLITTTTSTTTTVPVTTVATTVPPTSTSSSTTTAPTTSTSSTTTTTAPPAAARLVLGPDGIGDALFGADPDQVVAYVTSILGPPTSDSEWVNATSEFPECPGEELRVVRWRDLRLLFAETTPFVEGRRHFFSWVLGPPQRANVEPAGMLTASRLGVGNTIGEVRFTHPDVVLVEDPVRGPSFQLPDGVNGTADGLADGGFVTMIMSGPRCDGG